MYVSHSMKLMPFVISTHHLTSQRNLSYGNSKSCVYLYSSFQASTLLIGSKYPLHVEFKKYKFKNS